MEAGAIARNSDKLKANGCYVADPSAVASAQAMFPQSPGELKSGFDCATDQPVLQSQGCTRPSP
jgi:hypothetical protein